MDRFFSIQCNCNNASLDNTPGSPEKCTLNLAILSGSKSGLLSGHSRMVHWQSQGNILVKSQIQLQNGIGSDIRNI